MIERRVSKHLLLHLSAVQFKIQNIADISWNINELWNFNLNRNYRITFRFLAQPVDAKS